MALRTFQLYGQGYSNSAVNLTVTASGNTVFSGTVPTVDQPVPALPDYQLANSMVVLVSFDLDTSYSGQLPMTVTVNSGSVLFTKVCANYSDYTNPNLTSQQIQTLNDPSTSQADRVAIYSSIATPPFTQQELDDLNNPAVTWPEKTAILVAHNAAIVMPSGANAYPLLGVPGTPDDPRSNVSINGIAQEHSSPGLTSTWWWLLNAGDVFAYDLAVDPASL